jgi:hypothetical protein
MTGRAYRVGPTAIAGPFTMGAKRWFRSRRCQAMDWVAIEEERGCARRSSAEIPRE